MEISKSKKLKEKIIQKIKLEPNFFLLTSLLRTSKITFQENTVILAASGRYNFKVADEGIPLNGALRMMSGDIPWVDFYGYPPGRYHFYKILLLSALK